MTEFYEVAIRYKVYSNHPLFVNIRPIPDRSVVLLDSIDMFSLLEQKEEV